MKSEPIISELDLARGIACMNVVSFCFEHLHHVVSHIGT